MHAREAAFSRAARQCSSAPTLASKPVLLARKQIATTGRRALVVVNTASPTKEERKTKVDSAAPVKTTLPTTAPLTPSEEQTIELQWPKPRGWAEVALSKFIDTGEDIAVIARRTFNNAVPSPEALDQLFKRTSSGALKLKSKKPVVLVLGTGWGAHSLAKVIDVDLFEVVIVSPRNHFLFTPMLPSTAVGTVEFRSLLEPIRTSNPYAAYLEASCDRVDADKKVAYCTAAVAFEDGRRPQFEVPYDVLVVAVGERPATFGVPGVAEHCFFMKEVSDTVELRRRVQEAFELAALPGTSEEERRKVLRFVVVGGGPTGVEFAGTLNDFVRVDLARKYPE
eukprot:GHUV01006208.1.p1 GENE.GHUV01006208.1~~GHUV01006208.1.p1  ORF type:complete len:338 (+),score=70.72 GHUV01006208.1:311-1324(+)